MKNKINLRFGFIAVAIFVAAISRLLPHWPNFTPIGAMALFGAAYFTKKHWAFIIPLVSLWISDLAINNIIMPITYPEYYQGFTWFTSSWMFVYGGFALIALFGMFSLKKINFITVVGSSLVASTLFFLITNFGSWTANPMYPKTIEGLMASFTAGLPFFWNTVGGDLFYVGVLFGCFEFAKYRFPKLALARS